MISRIVTIKKIMNFFFVIDLFICSHMNYVELRDSTQYSEKFMTNNSNEYKIFYWK